MDTSNFSVSANVPISATIGKTVSDKEGLSFIHVGWQDAAPGIGKEVTAAARPNRPRAKTQRWNLGL
jgi:hypothetical protein